VVNLRIATRGSPLARWQAENVAAAVTAAHPGVVTELVIVETTGDRDRTTPLHQIGGQGVFVKEVQSAVLAGRADVAVHSAKDLRSVPTTGLTIAAVPERGDPRDAIVGKSLADLGTGAVLATGSVRRRAQLAALRPDLQFVELRGNVDTRLARLDSCDAVVVAAAALDRLGRSDRIAERLSTGVVVPQVGQGTLAVECRSDDTEVLALLAGLDDPASRAVLTAERAWLAQLGSGCDLPVGAHGRLGTDTDGGRVNIHLEGMLASLDGRVVLRSEASGPDPVELGTSLARRQLDGGGRDLIGALGATG